LDVTFQLAFGFGMWALERMDVIAHSVRLVVLYLFGLSGIKTDNNFLLLNEERNNRKDRLDKITPSLCPVIKCA